MQVPVLTLNRSAALSIERRKHDTIEPEAPLARVAAMRVSLRGWTLA